jgi:hypothetical protein
MPDKRRIQSPITLHVDSLDFAPVVEFDSERITVVDLEITEQMALKIVEHLTKRLEQEAFFGAIRMRFLGRLVL